jgi:hypothetical protein
MLQLETGKILIRPILGLQSSRLIVASIVELVSMWRLQSCGLQLDEWGVYHGEPWNAIVTKAYLLKLPSTHKP